jgi:hypothetical protein
MLHNGQKTTLHALVAAPGWHLLLCGPGWPDDPVRQLDRQVHVHHLDAAGPGRHGTAVRRLGLGPRDAAQVLVRPDGHIGYRAGGQDLAGLRSYVDRWLRRTAG